MCDKALIDTMSAYVRNNFVFGTTPLLMGIGNECCMICKLSGDTVTVHINPQIVFVKHHLFIKKKYSCLAVAATDENGIKFIRCFYGADIDKVLYGLNSLDIHL